VNNGIWLALAFFLGATFEQYFGAALRRAGARAAERLLRRRRRRFDHQVHPEAAPIAREAFEAYYSDLPKLTGPPRWRINTKHWEAFRATTPTWTDGQAEHALIMGWPVVIDDSVTEMRLEQAGPQSEGT
jgi:hypothetical protein